MHPRQLLNLLLVSSLIFCSFPILANDKGISAKQADEIINELKSIHQLLETRGGQGAVPTQKMPAPVDEPVKISMPETTNALGSADAPLVMLEFTDFQCPFCRQFHISVFEEIKKNFIDTGKLRYISRDYPLPFHAQAKPAANAVRCAGEQEHYWDYRHVVFLNAEKLTRDDLLTYARDLKFDVDQFTDCIDAEKYKDAIQQDITDASSIGIGGTPSFVIGKVGKDGIVHGVKLVGTQPYAAYEKKLNDKLKEK